MDAVIPVGGLKAGEMRLASWTGRLTCQAEKFAYLPNSNLHPLQTFHLKSSSDTRTTSKISDTLSLCKHALACGGGSFVLYLSLLLRFFCPNIHSLELFLFPCAETLVSSRSTNPDRPKKP
jgi:hypothetical protein